MFSVEQREKLRTELLREAELDSRISGAAITGSAAVGREDRWSDIDLAFAIANGNELDNVLSDWTVRMYRQSSALHHLDVRSDAWIYRMFLLPGTLQVDLAFVPAPEFRALGPTFKLVFGKAAESHTPPHSSPEELIGWAWLYAIHARTCIARRKLWQAEYMISGTRDHALALACLRMGLPVSHGRGMDELPGEVVQKFKEGLVRRL